MALEINPTTGKLDLVLSQDEIDHTNLLNIGVNSHVQVDSHLSSTSNPHNITWAQVDKTISDIGDITTKSHTSLTDIGTNTHTVIDSHIANGTLHFLEGSIDHGNILGLSDDDHTQYALLAGRSGGQTMYGGVGAGENLYLASTNHSTKGTIDLGLSLITIDETNYTITRQGSGILIQNQPPIAKDSIDPGYVAAFGVFVSGGYAYTTDQFASTLTIFDVNNPNAIVVKDSITTGSSGPVSLYVSGKYAYVSNSFSNTLAIFDVSDPDNIVAKGTTSTNLNSPSGIFVSGRYVYMVNKSSSTLAIFDISNPDNIIAKDTTSIGLNFPFDVRVSGIYAYVVGYNNNVLAIFDISDPDNIVSKGTISTGLAGPTGVYVSGRYAYVASLQNDTLAIFDISNPDNIIAKDTISTNLTGPENVRVSGRYAYVTNRTGNSIAVFDVSDPDNIIAKSTVGGVTTPINLDISGNYLYVLGTAFFTSSLVIYELTHNDEANLVVGSAKIAKLVVSDTCICSNDIDIVGSLTVGKTANFNSEVSINASVDLITGHFTRSTTSGITASTTQSQGQQPLTTDINEVSTVANVNDVVTMPSAKAGMTIVIINNGANTLQVFPASGDDLGAGINISVTLASGASITYIAYNTTNWEAV